MPLALATADALRRACVPFVEDAALARRTFWRVGGPADALVTARSMRDLEQTQRAASATGCPLIVLGNASNVLISDAGVRGIVLELDGDLAEVAPEATQSAPTLVAGGGLKLAVLLARARKHRWTGLECFAGIPGTVGGAVRMNAGSILGETKHALLDVEVVLASGQRARLTRDELAMSYRTTHLPPGAVIAKARLATTSADFEDSDRRIRAFIDRRKATQPLDLPSCGSTFRNPPGDAAGRLIEVAGLKGFTVGGAQVSHKHANFVVNLGAATAADIRAVIEHVERVVRDRFDVELEREVLYAGDWR